MFNLFRRLYCFATILALPALVAEARDPLPEQVKISPELPEWVKPIEPKINGHLPKNAASDGVWYLLSNDQVFPEKAEYYEHYSLRFLSTEGVENNSDVSVSIDPDYQTLHWHRLRILRDGEVIDLLPNQKFMVSENQSDRANLIYDNTLEILAIIEGSQKGDVLDYAYTIRGRNPITKDRFTYWFSQKFGVPVERIYSRIVQPKDTAPYRMRYLAEPDSNPIEIPAPQEEGDYLVTVFDRTEVAGVLRDADTPSDYISHPYVQVTNWESWQQVAEWAAELYLWDDPEDQEVELLIANLQTIQDPHEAVRVALNWVQEEIRYVGIMIGPHNYKPYPIPVTLERRFGDCKDKSQLLSYILRKVGIDADPVLVSTTEQRLVVRHMPTPMAFDHVITRIRIDGNNYYVDPTNWKQGGPLDEIYTPEYSWGLPLETSTEKLERLPGQGYEASTTEITETYKMHDYSGAVRFSSVSEYGGAEADYIRRYFERNSDEEIDKDYTNFYAAQFPNIQSERPPTIRDDWKANKITTDERYLIKDAWTHEDGDDKQYFEVYPDILRDSITVSSTRLRSMPAEQTYPLETTQVIEIVLPAGGNFEPESETIRNEWFEFDYKVHSNDRKLTIHYRFKTLTAEIAAADYPDYAFAIDQLNDLLGYSIYNNIGPETEGSAVSMRLYLPTALAAGYSAVIGLGLGLWLVTRRKHPHRPAAHPELDGIQGWLILPAIGMVLIPFILIGQAVEMVAVFDHETMFSLTEPGSASHHPGYTALVLAEVSWQFFCLPMGFALSFCFFAKRAITPAFYITFLMARGLLSIADTLAANSITNGSAMNFDEGSIEGFTITKDLVIACLWSAYFLASKRVKSTFRK